jgi:cytochrome c peroxidase
MTTINQHLVAVEASISGGKLVGTFKDAMPARSYMKGGAVYVAVAMDALAEALAAFTASEVR